MADTPPSRSSESPELPTVETCCRLDDATAQYVAQLEQLGYELAHKADPDVVSAVFIAATDLQVQIDRLSQRIGTALSCPTHLPLAGDCA